jgi:hypothetical protein
MTDFFLIICVNLFIFLFTFFQMFKIICFDLYQNIIDTTLKVLNIHVNFLYYNSCILFAFFFFLNFFFFKS